MGFFRRFKLTDHTADECRQRLEVLLVAIRYGPRLTEREEDYTDEDTIELMEEWACFRELLARHEKNNQSSLDKNNDQSNNRV